MNQDEIWQKVKNDESTIYGQPIFDVFLQLTEDLLPKHFFELNKTQIEKLNSASIYNLLSRSRMNVNNFEKICETLGTKEINKLNSEQINVILHKHPDSLPRTHPEDYQATFTAWSGAYDDDEDGSLEKLTLIKIISKYKNFNKIDVSNLLLNVENNEELKEILKVIGNDKLKMLDSDRMLRLLTNYLDKYTYHNYNIEKGIEMFDTFAKALGEHFNNISSKDMLDFIVNHLKVLLQFYRSNLNQMFSNNPLLIKKILKALEDNEAFEQLSNYEQNILSYYSVLLRLHASRTN